MKRHSRIGLLFALILTAAACSPAEPTRTATRVPTAASSPTPLPPPTATSEAVETIEPTALRRSVEGQRVERAVDAFLQAYVKDGRFSGSILIARNGDILVSKGYGMANLEHDVPNTPQTKFRLGSITKQFTAMAIMVLQERGQLSVHDPICDHMPDCPVEWQPITIHHLLTHSSGIPSFTSFPDYTKTMTLRSPVGETIQRFRDKPLEFAPGTRHSYSNSGYIVLGDIIERVSGKSYAAYLADIIFQPLKMVNTGYDSNQLVLKGRASGYRRVSADRFLNADYIDMSIPHAAGGLYSTVEDLFLWDRALYTEALVSQGSLDSMFTPYLENYGYGWIITEAAGHKLIFHGGGVNGFVAVIGRFVNDDVVINVLSNIENAPMDDIGAGLIEIVFGDE